MVEKIQAIRGMNDILPEEVKRWQNVEAVFSRCLHQYAYQEIRFPLLESTNLFKRGIGEVTDIVEKEMYTFNDLNGDSLSLRPEGTASCIRACIEHGLLYNQQQKLWYMGPMFRHEKPQKGRYRQFHQLGVEALGIPGTAIELELIALCKHIWEALGIGAFLKLHINTIGTLAERQVYKKNLVVFLQDHFDALDEDSKRRLHTNPLRILDSKIPSTQAILADAPKLQDALEQDSRLHFEALQRGLDALQISFEVNPCLVRGLDYYSHSVFEWVTDQLGSQSAVCAGGRYDGLVEQLGGKATPAVGFAIGLERLLLLQALVNMPRKMSSASLFFIVGEESMQDALVLAQGIRDRNPLYQVIVDTAGGSFKSQFKRADKSGAQLALILGSDELRNKQISVKNLRSSEEQKTLPLHELESYIRCFVSQADRGDEHVSLYDRR